MQQGGQSGAETEVRQDGEDDAPGALPSEPEETGLRRGFHWVESAQDRQNEGRSQPYKGAKQQAPQKSSAGQPGLDTGVQEAPQDGSSQQHGATCPRLRAGIGGGQQQRAEAGSHGAQDRK